MSNTESTQFSTSYQADEAGSRWTTQSAWSAFLLISEAMNNPSAPDYTDAITPGLARFALTEMGTKPSEVVQTWLDTPNAPVTREILNYTEDSVMECYTEIIEAERNYGPEWSYSDEGLSFRSSHVALKMVHKWLAAQ